jgi:hypothetical protein
MPTTVTALVIVLVAVFPGLVGDLVYRSLVGVDWREKDWQTVLRLLGFSIVGLVIYAIPAGLFGWPPPVYVSPDTYQTIKPPIGNLNYIFIPYAGHLCGGFLAGLLGAWGTRLLALFSSRSAYPAAWDDFVRTYSPSHWVVVGLTNGGAYAGKLKTVDCAVSASDRDMVLEEPCQYDVASGHYIALNYQYMFISASSLFSLAVVYDPNLDNHRTIPVGERLFEGGHNGHQDPDPTATPEA